MPGGFPEAPPTAVNVTVENRLFVVAVLGKTLDLFPFDRQSALVLVDACRFDTRTSTMVPCTPEVRGRGIANVGRLFAEDGAQQLFFRRHRLSPFGVILPTRMSPHALPRDIDDAGFVEVLQPLLPKTFGMSRVIPQGRAWYRGPSPRIPRCGSR